MASLIQLCVKCMDFLNVGTGSGLLEHGGHRCRHSAGMRRQLKTALKKSRHAAVKARISVDTQVLLSDNIDGLFRNYCLPTFFHFLFCTLLTRKVFVKVWSNQDRFGENLLWQTLIGKIKLVRKTCLNAALSRNFKQFKIIWRCIVQRKAVRDVGKYRTKIFSQGQKKVWPTNGFPRQGRSPDASSG